MRDKYKLLNKHVALGIVFFVGLLYVFSGFIFYSSLERDLISVYKKYQNNLLDGTVNELGDFISPYAYNEFVNNHAKQGLSLQEAFMKKQNSYKLQGEKEKFLEITDSWKLVDSVEKGDTGALVFRRPEPIYTKSGDNYVYKYLRFSKISDKWKLDVDISYTLKESATNWDEIFTKLGYSEKFKADGNILKTAKKNEVVAHPANIYFKLEDTFNDTSCELYFNDEKLCRIAPRGTYSGYLPQGVRPGINELRIVINGQRYANVRAECRILGMGGEALLEKPSREYTLPKELVFEFAY